MVVVRREAAALELQQLGTTLGVEVLAAPWPASYRDLDAADLVVSTTPAGATDPLAATGWRADLPLMDVLYAPWPTPLGGGRSTRPAPWCWGDWRCWWDRPRSRSR